MGGTEEIGRGGGGGEQGQLPRKGDGWKKSGRKSESLLTFKTWEITLCFLNPDVVAYLSKIIRSGNTGDEFHRRRSAGPRGGLCA